MLLESFVGLRPGGISHVGEAKLILNVLRRVRRAGLGDFTQRGNRYVGLALFEEGEAEVVAGGSVLWLKPQGFQQVLDGIIGLAFTKLANGKEVARLRVVGQCSDDFLKVIGGTSVLLFFETGNAVLELFVGVDARWWNRWRRSRWRQRAASI